MPGKQQGQSVYNGAYTEMVTGAISGETTATILPSIKSVLVRFKAQSGNAGNVYLGSSTSATKPTDSTTDTTTGFELDAGDDTGWIPLSNLNLCFIICDNAGDDLTYWVLR